MKKAFIAGLMACIFLLCACTPNPEYLKEKLQVTLKPYELPEIQPEWVTLYYPSQDGSHVLAFSHKMQKSDSLYMDIMTALLYGTSDGYVSPFPQGVSVRSIMLVQNILYIDMSWQFSQMQTEKLFACVAVLVSTFTALSEVSFINITVEGQQLTHPGMPEQPIMLLSSYSGSINELLTHHNNLLAAKKADQIPIETFYGVVYVQDETGKYIVPETVSITVNDGDYASAIVSTLLARSTAIFPNGFMLPSSPAYNDATGEVYIDLVCPDTWRAPTDWLAPNALISALNSLYSQCRRLVLTVTDSRGNEIFALNEEAVGYFDNIRSLVKVITPNSTGKGLAETSMLVSNMPGSGSVKEFINEYICLTNPYFRGDDGIVNDVIINNDTVIIDLGTAYYEYYSGENAPRNQESEYAIIYSLIATACAYTGATKALILQDSQTRTTFAGYIVTDKPLLNLPSKYLSTIE